MESSGSSEDDDDVPSVGINDPTINTTFAGKKRPHTEQHQKPRVKARRRGPISTNAEALTMLMQRGAANPHDRSAWVAALTASGLSPEEAVRAASAAVAPYFAHPAGYTTTASPTSSPTVGEDAGPPAAGDNDAAAATLAAMHASSTTVPFQQLGVSPGASSGGGILLDDEEDIAAVKAVARLSSPQRAALSPPPPRPGFDAARAGGVLQMRPSHGPTAVGGSAHHHGAPGSGLFTSAVPRVGGVGVAPAVMRPAVNIIGRPWSEEEKRVLLTQVRLCDNHEIFN